MSLDDLLAVMREFVCPNVSRSGLDRCLRRHGVVNLRNLLPPPEKAAHKPFKAYLPGYLHMDVKYLPQMAARPAEAISSWPSTAPRAGYISLSTPTRAPP